MMMTIVIIIIILIIIIMMMMMIIIIIIIIISSSIIRITKVRIGSDLNHFSTDFIQKGSQVRKGSPFQGYMKCNQHYLT